ncbi:HMG box-containing protein 4 [Myripristis murdjan]|uniref:HMG box-containing protein 4-like n=1 Tax=Myripristis murdjan TaxID=586833 RepID=A0A668ATV4_9TELE|nr:HMG box-containing protein 4-like [Myripristis murdjan]
MDGEVGLVTGRVQRERKRSYKDFLVDVEDLEESDDEDYSTKKLYKEPKGLHKKKRQHSDNSGVGSGPYGVTSPGFLPVYPVYVTQGQWRQTALEENGTQDNLLHSGCTAEGSIDQVNHSPIVEYWVHLNDQQDTADCPLTDLIPSAASPVTCRPHPFISTPNSVTDIASTVSFISSPVISTSSSMADMASPTSSVCSPPSSASDTPRSTSRGPSCSDLDPINAAAHLHLLGESLSLIGQQLQETNKMACVSGSLSLLLDSLLCALAPLVCLTSQIQELRLCTQHTLADTLENIAYVMPGL